MGKTTDIRIVEVQTASADYRYRVPIKFGGRALDRATVLSVAVEAETRGGKRARGFGSMPLGNVWAWPSKALPYETTLEAMQGLAERIARIVPGACGAEWRHPVEHGFALEAGLEEAAAETVVQLGIRHPMPRLAALVTASAFDAAIHDAFGKANGINCYQGYGQEHMNHDLSRYLDGRFAGEYLDAYTLREPKPTIPLYHLVGALDPLTDADAPKRVRDGLPETLAEWITADGLTHLKVKLNGNDLDWDVSRVVAVERVTAEVQERAGRRSWHYSLDFNEQCRNVDYLLEFVWKVKEHSPEAFARVEYIEQPTARDLEAHPENKMHAVAKVKPVVIDESLVDYGSLLAAMEMGYTGVALKACKGQTQSLVLGAAAQKLGLFLCVQDLTCTGLSYLESVSLASRIPGVAAVEGNGRQYCPAANKGWDGLYPSTFKVRDGTIETGALCGTGLGLVGEGFAPRGLARPGEKAI